jgi:AAA domain
MNTCNPETPSPAWLVSVLSGTLRPGRSSSRRPPERSGSEILNCPGLGRGRAYLKRTPGVKAGEGKAQGLVYFLACNLVCEAPGLALDVDTALSLMKEDWNERCDPPWPDWELRHTLENAKRNGFAYGMRDRNGEAPERRPPAKDKGTPQSEEKPLPPDVTADQVRRRKVEWLWLHYMQRGALVAVDGMPGVGKSTFMCAAAADTTGGPRLPGPDREPRHLGDVAIFASEDGVTDTVLDRLKAAAAVMSRVHFFGHDKEGEAGWWPYFPGDEDTLEKLIRRHGVRLLYFDQIDDHVADGFDLNTRVGARAVLRPIRDVGRRTGCTIAFSRHTTKAPGRPAVHQGQGHVSITGICRQQLLVAPDPRQDDRYVLAVGKNNAGPKGASLAYRITASEEGSLIRWEDATDVAADDLGGPPEDVGKRGSREEARRLIRLRVKADGYPARSLFHEAETHLGISKETMKRAKKELGVWSQEESKQGEKWWLWMPPPGGFPPEA